MLQGAGQEAWLEGQQLPGDERQVCGGQHPGTEGQGVWKEVHGMCDASTGGETGGHQGAWVQGTQEYTITWLRGLASAQCTVESLDKRVRASESQ